MSLFRTHYKHRRKEDKPSLNQGKRNMTVTVNENRAPTDKSIGLLNEFTEKATSNLIYSRKVEQNNLKVIALYFRDDIISDRVHFKIKFKLNEREVVIEDFVDNFEWKQELAENYCGFGNRHIFITVYKKLSEMIAAELMNQSPEFIKEFNKL